MDFDLGSKSETAGGCVHQPGIEGSVTHTRPVIVLYKRASGRVRGMISIDGVSHSGYIESHFKHFASGDGVAGSELGLITRFRGRGWSWAAIGVGSDVS